MDPELYDSMCVCPVLDCDEGRIRVAWGDLLDGMECGRCQGTGYVLRENLQSGEECYSALDQRYGIDVIPDGLTRMERDDVSM